MIGSEYHSLNTMQLSVALSYLPPSEYKRVADASCPFKVLWETTNAPVLVSMGPGKCEPLNLIHINNILHQEQPWLWARRFSQSWRVRVLAQLLWIDIDSLTDNRRYR